MTDLSSLIARVEAATGPDRELDAYIYAWVDGRDIIQRANGLFGRNQKLPYDECYLLTFDKPRDSRVGHVRPDLPSYTASLDAVVALARHLFPKCAGQALERAMRRRRFKTKGDLRELPLALCLALLRAKHKEQTDATTE